MNVSTIQKNVRLFFSVFTLLFTIAYFPSPFNYYTPRYAKANAHSSLEECVTQSGASIISTGQQLNKITALDHPDFDIALSDSSINIVQSKALFISLFERNVFYVFTTIHAPQSSSVIIYKTFLCSQSRTLCTYA
jgi:hypothetical protein